MDDQTRFRRRLQRPHTQVVTGRDGETRLLVATENNGVRLYEFTDDGNVIPTPVAESLKLRTDMTTPIVVDSVIDCVKDFLICLDADSLQERWRTLAAFDRRDAEDRFASSHI